ncbi:MAG: hypothetical protein IJE08_01335 [Clostridia bacterium]|nr:hypothetical protein [Clostridia bacterium]
MMNSNNRNGINSNHNGNRRPAGSPAAGQASIVDRFAPPAAAPQLGMSPANVRLSYGVYYTLVCLIIDISGSTKKNVQGSAESIHAKCIECAGRFMDDLREKMDNRILMSIYTFSGDGVQKITSNQLLRTINTQEVQARFGEPKGLTPMGEAICTAIRDVEAFRKQMIADGYKAHAPIISVMTDGKATDSLDEAFAMLDARLGARPRPKAVFIPVGIGDEADFNDLKRMLREDIAADELCVLHSSDDFTSYVRLLNATTIAVASGETFKGAGGLRGGVSIFTGA